jgi:hypothetical protein
MTLGTDQKRHMLKRFRKCYQHEYPRDVTVYIRDSMTDIHFKVFCVFVVCVHSLTRSLAQDKSVVTVQHYIDKVVLRGVREILDDPAKRVSTFYMLLDRYGSCCYFFV